MYAGLKTQFRGAQIVMVDFQPSKCGGLGLRVMVRIGAWVMATVRVMVGVRVIILLRSG